MSFRSRSRNTQPVAPRRRAHSSSRASTSATGQSDYSYNGGYYGASGGYNTGVRPLSTGYYQNSSSGSGYQSPYASIYSSRDNLYSTGSSQSLRNGSGHYYTNGNGTIARHYDYSNANAPPPPPSSSSSSSLSTYHHSFSYAKAYSTHATYCNNYSNNYSNSSSSIAYGNGGGESRYVSNPYHSDRYVSPYSSVYDNGVTTASLSLSRGTGASGKKSTTGSGLTPSNSFKGSNSYLNNNPKSSMLLNSKSLSTSNSSVNAAYATTPSSSSQSAASAAAAAAAIVARSNSLREQERKSRNRTRSRSVAQRSLSASSEKSEGYESGGERVSRSRLGSNASSTTTATNATSTSDDKSSRDKSDNGDFIDYKALWEAAKLENDKLKQQLKKKDDEIIQSRATLERFTNATTKNSLSEIEKRERRAMERKLSEMEEELKQLEVFKTENQRLKEENGALIRVISKLSK